MRSFAESPINVSLAVTFRGFALGKTISDAFSYGWRPQRYFFTGGAGTGSSLTAVASFL